jgi:predicted house-cleaning noncanonical NTP pyrophosphatase (MazG superfamily)
MTIYNKLVRDRIVEILKKKELNPKSHIANEKEYWLKLKEKLAEEVKEFNESESAEELADILEIIDAICIYKNIDKQTVLEIKSSKTNERGAFKERIILEEA